MKTRVLILGAALGAFLGACNGDLPPAPPDPTPPAPPAPIGHWNLEGSTTGEHLWIEADGTFTEAGGTPIYALSLFGTLSSGPWLWSPPTLTLDDPRTHGHGLASLAPDGTLVVRIPSASFRFAREGADAGAD